MKILIFLRQHWIALAIITAGFLIRLYNLEKIAGFDFDQETAAWWVKHFLVDHKISLIGQEISIGGIYTGPGYYYLLSLFYYLFGGSPLAGNYLQLLLGFVSMVILYRLGGRTPLFLYAFSTSLITIDQTATPSSPMILLGIVALFLANSLPAQLTLTGIGWHFHPTAVLLAPIGLVRHFLKKPNQKRPILYGILLGGIFFLPLLLFDLRHDFLHIKNLYQLFLGSSPISNGYPIFFRMLVSSRIFLESWLNIFAVPGKPLMIVAVLVIIIQFREYLKNYLPWFILPIVFLGIYPRAFPEYYYFLIYPVIVIASAKILDNIALKSSKAKIISLLVLASFLVINLISLVRRVNPYPIRDKLDAVNYLVSQSRREGKPLTVKVVSDPGQGNGFKYLLWLASKNENVFSEKSTYTIFVPGRLSSHRGTEFGNLKITTNE